MKCLICGKDREVFMTSLQVFYTKAKNGYDIRYSLMGHASGGYVDVIASFKSVDTAIHYQIIVDAQIEEDAESEEEDLHLPLTPLKSGKSLSFVEMLSDLPFPEVANG